MKSGIHDRFGKYFVRRFGRIITLRDREENLPGQAMCEKPFDFLANPYRGPGTA